jgi:tetratricopeptide (TPR) repeat protein
VRRHALVPTALLIAAALTAPGPVSARHKEKKVKPGKMEEAPAEGSKPSLHTPDEIYKIMEKSSLTYEIDIKESLPPPAAESPRVLSSELLLTQQGDDLQLVAMTPSAGAREALDAAEQAFEKKEYASAIEGYRKVLEIDPSFVHALTLLGDVYYSRAEYDQAAESFQKAIDRNFADYDAHWFLADTEWKLGNKAQAIEEITIAHLLNVNHEKLKQALLRLRDEIGRPWKDWDYSPRFTLSRDGGKIKVVAQEGWIGYALVKAVWAYEPGYAESAAGPDYGKNAMTDQEEKEALLAVLNDPKSPQQLSRIVDDGYVNEFLYYEVLARGHPAAIVLLPRELFMRVVHYVDTYH